MVTARASWTSGAPTTQYTTYADLISQDQAGNTSYVYNYLQAVNRGSTSSFSNVSGSQSATLGGSAAGTHSGTMPSGYATGAQRWMDGPVGIIKAHDASGNRSADSVVQTISGWFSNTTSGTGPSYPRIPKPASVPGTPVASNILPTSVQLDWTASTDNGGSTIDGYLVRRWPGSDMTGIYTDVSTSNTLTRVDTGLNPGTQYTYAIYAHNGSSGGYSLASGPVTITTLASMHIKISGTYKNAVPYIKVNGIYKVLIPYIKYDGIYKPTG